ncbi:transposase [Pseudomonas sp. CGJS7]|uniref:transposase n=1 Tax=Pseudomonas sp. CGJS7 TaxID=3109348 RepID=UPI00300AC642
MSQQRIEPRPHLLCDEQWLIVASHLPRHYQARILNNTGDYRAFIEAVLWVVENNAPWTSIPSCYGSWRAIYVRFLRWVQDEHWIAVEQALGVNSAMAHSLLERVERYRASNRWRRHKGRSEPSGHCGELYDEIAVRWGGMTAA